MPEIDRQGSVHCFADGDWFVIQNGVVLRARYVGSETFVCEIDGREVDAITWFDRYIQEYHNAQIGALFAIGLAYEKAYRSGNLRAAAAGWRIASEFDDTRAAYNLGMCLRDGDLGRVDPEGAFRLFRQGATFGHVGCLRELAFCYAEGFGVARDMDKAWKMINRAEYEDDILAFSTLLNEFDDSSSDSDSDS